MMAIIDHVSGLCEHGLGQGDHGAAYGQRQNGGADDPGMSFAKGMGKLHRGPPC